MDIVNPIYEYVVSRNYWQLKSKEEKYYAPSENSIVLLCLKGVISISFSETEETNLLKEGQSVRIPSNICKLTVTPISNNVLLVECAVKSRC